MNQKIKFKITSEIEVSESGHYKARFMYGPTQDGDVIVYIEGDSPFLHVGRIVAYPTLAAIDRLAMRESLVIYKRLEMAE